MRVVSLQPYQEEVAKSLEALIREARAGRITGLVYACRYSASRRHKLGMSGIYRRDLLQTIGISSWLLRQLQNLYEHRVVKEDMD